MQCGKVSFLVQIIIVLHFQVMYYKGLPIWASLKNCCIIFDHSIVEIGSNAVQGLLGPNIKKVNKSCFWTDKVSAILKNIYKIRQKNLFYPIPLFLLYNVQYCTCSHTSFCSCFKPYIFLHRNRLYNRLNGEQSLDVLEKQLREMFEKVNLFYLFLPQE